MEIKTNIHRTELRILTNYFVTVAMLVGVSLVIPPLKFTYWFNGLHSPVLDFLFASITNLGDGIFTALFAVGLLFYRFHLGIAMVLNGLLQGIVVSICKRVLFTGVLRPVAYIDTSLVHTVEGVELHRLMSFPSGHTVTIFGLSIFLSLCLRNRTLTILLLMLSLLVGLSRVYLLQHFILDVSAGAIIGSIVGAVSYYVFENMKRPKSWPQRIVVRIPEPRPRQKSISKDNRFASFE